MLVLSERDHIEIMTVSLTISNGIRLHPQAGQASTLQTATTVVCLFHSLKSKEWHLKGGEWQAKSVVCTRLDTWPRYKVIIFRDRWETKTPPKLRDIVTSTSHLCHIFVTIHDCIVRARVDDCTTVIMQFLSFMSRLFDNVIVCFVFSITLFSTFTTLNYTDEENDGHQNVIITQQFIAQCLILSITILILAITVYLLMCLYRTWFDLRG